MKTGILLLGFLVCALSAFTANPLWMRYSAISPDGKQIVFSYQDDLYLVSSSGGDAEAITRHIAHEKSPVWSADGKKIAFASDRFGNYDVFVLTLEDGSIERLTFHSADDIPSGFNPDGQSVLFYSVRKDDPKSIQFPYKRLGELYETSLDGSLHQKLSLSAELAIYSPDGKQIYYHDKKGYEDPWRKHHVSSVTRDIIRYNLEDGSFTTLTDYEGEDRNPVLGSGGDIIYYLSEAGDENVFNIWQMATDGSNREQLTAYDTHPVRFLSRGGDNILCFGYRGEIYLLKGSGPAEKVEVNLQVDHKRNDVKYKDLSSLTQMALSPDGKEVAFIIRGDVFVSSVDYSNTRQITNTAWQERSVSFSPDGRSLLYASERGGAWSVFQTSIQRENEKHFFAATLLEEKAIVQTNEDCFQPAYSPDGKEVAFLEDREKLRVIELESGKVRIILDGSQAYSYSDGDQWFQWSPDGKWFAVQFHDPDRWVTECGLISSDGKGDLINLSRSGYSENRPVWMADGDVIMYYSDRYGLRSHGSWGSQMDIMAYFVNEKAYEKFNTTKSLLEEIAEEPEEGGEKDIKESKKEITSIVLVELEGIYDRRERLSLHSANLNGAYLSKDMEKLYYLAKFEKGHDLWLFDLKERKASMIKKFQGSASNLIIDEEEQHAYVIASGKPVRIKLQGSETRPIAFKAAKYIDYAAERDYMFDHMWRQVKEKFYRVELHGIDWEAMKTEYERFLPHINNNRDFAEMMSELLGELNASHTGCKFSSRWNHADQTASLGIYPDYDYRGEGVRVLALTKGGPVDRAGELPESGFTIRAINGQTIESLPHYFALLNHQQGKRLLLELNGAGKTYELYVQPISLGQERQLLYKNWVEGRRAACEKLSNGRIGYVHIESMGDAAFRQVFEDLLGKNSGKEAVVVDTRFNGGGWLHDDLAVLLNGKRYVDFVPRGDKIGSDPFERWYKPSAILVGEGNYSDAHGFPYAYQTLEIGPVVGMPVPGTMTAVWWEQQMDPTLVFGIPQVGTIDLKGDYLENQQLEPNLKVDNEESEILNGKDKQLEAAVQLLLDQLVKK